MLVNFVQDGVLALPLYHGTSSVNVVSVYRNGLGARNPVDELKVIPFLRRLYDVACTVIPDGESLWQSHRGTVERIVNQEVTRSGWNFRHGGSYLTPSRSAAIRYAESSPEGSEIITETKQIYQLVQRYSPEEGDRFASDNPALVRRFQVTGRPFLIEADKVPVAQLRSENGEDAASSLGVLETMLRSCRDEKQIDMLCQQENFELVGVLSSARLVFYRSADNSNEWQVIGDPSAETC